LGSGSFGEVHKGVYVDSENNQYNTAIKRMTPKSTSAMRMILKEISAMQSMADIESNYAPRVYGCNTFTQYPEKVYVAQELLAGDLDSRSFRSFFQDLSNADSIRVVYQLFKGLAHLWKAGYVHNDIKPANMMHRTNKNNVVLIDFGLAQGVGSVNKAAGTPIFMSPPKFTEKDKVQPMDDIYSLALSVAVMESKGGYDAVFKGVNSKYGSTKGCFQSHTRKVCRNIIATNVKAILEKSGYGKYNKDAEMVPGINLTTFIVKIIYFTGVNLSYKDALDILREMHNIECNKENGAKLDANEKVEQAQRDAEAKRLEDIKKQEELKLYLEQKEKAKLEQREREKIQREKELAKQEQQRKIKLEQIEKDKQAKQDKIDQAKVEKYQNEQANRLNQLMKQNAIIAIGKEGKISDRNKVAKKEVQEDVQRPPFIMKNDYLYNKKDYKGVIVQDFVEKDPKDEEFEQTVIQQKKDRENRIAQLQKEIEALQGEIKNHEKAHVRNSEFYNENKDMFKRHVIEDDEEKLEDPDEEGNEQMVRENLVRRSEKVQQYFGGKQAFDDGYYNKFVQKKKKQKQKKIVGVYRNDLKLAQDNYPVVDKYKPINRKTPIVQEKKLVENKKNNIYALKDKRYPNNYIYVPEQKDKIRRII